MWLRQLNIVTERNFAFVPIFVIETADMPIWRATIKTAVLLVSIFQRTVETGEPIFVEREQPVTIVIPTAIPAQKR